MATKSTRTPAQQAAIERARAARKANAAARASAEIADAALADNVPTPAALNDRDTLTSELPLPVSQASDQVSAARAEAEAVSDIHDMGQTLAADEKVLFIIPLDPDLGSGCQIWERAFNGLILRFTRGVPLMQPKFIADYVESCLRIERISRDSVAAFQTPGGKKLNY